MLKCIIVEKKGSATSLENHIRRIPFLKIVATFSNPMDALLNFNSTTIDLIFLDIPECEQAPIQFLTLLQNRAQVIITSANKDNAIVGFEHNVTDCLLHPVSFERFFKAVDKVLIQKKLLERVEISRDLHPATGGYIFVKFETRIVRVELDDILFIEGLKNYVSIYTKTQRIVTLQVMKQLEKVLPPNRFVRIHKSYIVALDKIGSIERNEIHIHNQILPIGVTYQQPFLRLLESRWALSLF
jgi:DNA-binding LytR/AlgR family response regulator